MKLLAFSTLPGFPLPSEPKTLVVHRIEHCRKRECDILGFISFDLHNSKSVQRRNRLVGYLESKGMNIRVSPINWAQDDDLKRHKERTDLERFSMALSKTYNEFNRKRANILKLHEFPEFKHQRFEQLKNSLNARINMLQTRYECSIKDYLYEVKPNLKPLQL